MVFDKRGFIFGTKLSQQEQQRTTSQIIKQNIAMTAIYQRPKKKERKFSLGQSFNQKKIIFDTKYRYQNSSKNPSTHNPSSDYSE